MRQLFGTAVLAVAMLFFLLTAWSSGTAPAAFAQRLGLAIVDPGGVNEIRAQYAGFFLAAALVCLASLVGTLSRQSAFIVIAAIFGGLMVGRFASLMLDGGIAGYGPTIRALLVIDVVGFALGITALVSDRAS